MKKKFKKILILFLIFSILVNLEFTSAIFAQEATSSAEIEDSSNTLLNEDIPAAISKELNSPNTLSPTPAFSGFEGVPSAQIHLAPIIRTLAKRSFKANERIIIDVDNVQNQTVTAQILDANGEEQDFETFTIDQGARKEVVVKPPIHFKPGKYKIKVILSSGQSYEQDFAWGVLAINTNKSIYLAGETAKLAMAVLDEKGEMVCDANINLEIINPKSEITTLSTENGKIKVNPACQKKEITIEPDYEAEYNIDSEIGKYQMSLTAQTKNGTYSIDDFFEVRESVLFDIERITATRIFPPYPYPVDINIIANQDFTGTIAEIVPGNFAIDPSSTSEYKYTELKTVSSQAAESGVLGASTSALLGPPYEGSVPINQEFGQHLRDPHERDFYAQFNLAGHDGVDFDMPEGTPVFAADDGKVALAGNGAYGITVVLDHSWGRSYYGHLSLLKVKLGEQVKKGDEIALSGNTGLSTGAHLHFGIKPSSPDMQNGYYGKTDPLPLLGIQSTLDPNNQAKIIYWNISVKKGDKFTLSYFYKAPDISPQFYKLGPLRFYENEQNIFQETRQWQVAVDADGSGENPVDPATGQISATQKTYTFTFNPSEAMDSGGITIEEPTADDWTVPQGSAGSAGYTTAVGTGNATVGDVLNNANEEDPTSPAGIWKEVDPDMCGTTNQNDPGDVVVDTSNKKEGTGSIQCADTNGQPDNNDAWGFIYDANQDWSTFCNGGACTQISWWQYAANVNTEAFEFDVDSGTDISTAPLVACAGSVTTANTWEYRTCDMSAATLTTVRAFGFSCTNNSCLPFETNNFNVDEFLIGPGVPTFSGTSPWLITVRFLDLAAADTVTITYGDGGGTSGVDNSATEGSHTFTTSSKTLVDGSYTPLTGGSPIVTLSSGPTLDQLMRHGKWLEGGVENAFTF